ncbi:hypothetical protein THASP1DRAFT_28886, partial [Thamnocephalis sphaerospora]
MAVFNDLPNELLLRLASYLPANASLRLTGCTSRLYRVLRSYRPLGRRIYVEAFPDSSSERELYHWLLMTSKDALASSTACLLSAPSAELPLGERGSVKRARTDEVAEMASATEYETASDSSSDDMDMDVEDMPWLAGASTNDCRDSIDWWDLLQRRGRIATCWRKVAPKHRTLPLPPHIEHSNVNVVAARPWGMVLAVSGSKDRLFWADKLAAATSELNRSVTSSPLAARCKKEDAALLAPEDEDGLSDDHDEDAAVPDTDLVPDFVAGAASFACEFDFMVPHASDIQSQTAAHLPGVTSFTELALDDAVLNPDKRCDANEHYIVHATWIPTMNAASVHVWRIGQSAPWLVLATAEQCWVAGLHGHWLLLRQRERFEEHYHLCVVNLRTRQRHAHITTTLNAGRHLHQVTRNTASLFVCEALSETAADAPTVGAAAATATTSIDTDDVLMFEWCVWQTQHVHWHAPANFIDLAANALGTATAVAPPGTPSLVRMQYGVFALPSATLHGESARRTVPFISTLAVNDTHVLLKIGPRMGNDFTHLGLLALDAKCNSNSGQLLWLCEANVTGVELLPGNDLLLAWSSGSGVHQLRRLSTGECVRTFFGRRWHPAVPAL